MEVDAVILVEGQSDRAALEAVAGKQRRDLGAEGISIVAMGGASPFSEEIMRYTGRCVVAGLCDDGEVEDLRRGLAWAGFGHGLTRAEMEDLGFFVCVADLEDELIRALGPDEVVKVIESSGELSSLRRMQAQPAWRGRAIHEQLRRFFGSKSGRKKRYGQLLVEALDLGQIPRPLVGVLEAV